MGPLYLGRLEVLLGYLCGGGFKETLRFVPMYILKRRLWTRFDLSVFRVYEKPLWTLAEASPGATQGIMKTGGGLKANSYDICTTDYVGVLSSWLL